MNGNVELGRRFEEKGGNINRPNSDGYHPISWLGEAKDADPEDIKPAANLVAEWLEASKVNYDNI